MLQIPSKYRVVALLAVGYPRDRFDPLGKALRLVRKRKQLKEIASLNEYGKPPNTA